MIGKRQLMPLIPMISLMIILSLFMKASAFSVVELKEVAFSYRPEIEPYFIVETFKIRNMNSGYIDKSQEMEIYKRVYESTESQDMDFNAWISQGKPSPNIFKIRVRVKNYGNEASSEIPVNILVQIKNGEYFVDQTVFMVDRDHLEQTAKWTRLKTLKGVIPVLAPNETYDYFSEPVYFGSYLLGLKHQFPAALKATAGLSSSETGKTSEVPVYTAPFALEDLQK